MNFDLGGKWLCFGLVSGFVFALPAQSQEPAGLLPAAETKVIAVVRDGDSWYFDPFIEVALAQLRDLSKGAYEIEVRERNAAYDNDEIARLLREALADDEVDLVYAPGVVGTEKAAALPDEARTVPVMGGSVQYSDLRGPRISSLGTSSARNFTFITNPTRIESDLKLLKDLSGERTLYAVIEARMIPELRVLAEAQRALEARIGARTVIVPVSGGPEQTLASIPGTAKAVYVTILPRMSPEERTVLYDGLAKRGITTVAMEGRSDVVRGALAGLAPDNQEAVARRTAINIHQIFQGVSTDLLPVYLPFEDNLVINAETARKANWSPDHETVLSAQFINEDALLGATEPLDVYEAMRRAARSNAEVTATREGARIAEGDVRVVRSARLPQVEMKGSHGYSHIVDPVFPLFASRNSHEGRYGFEIRQVLFNDELFSNLRATRESAEAARFETLSVELDAIESAAVAYFDGLLAEALYDIEKQNLRLTENNLQLAKLRIEIGSAEPAERFRWEQDVARDRANLFQRDSERSDAWIELNRILGEPRERRWKFQDYRVANQAYFFMDDEMNGLVSRKREFEQLRAFLQALAVENSPELEGFDRSLEAQGILLGQKKRRHLLPEISAFSSQERVVQERDELIDTANQHESLVGFQFSYPVFEGQLKAAEVDRQEARIRQLEAQRENALQLIEQRALAAVNGIASLHPGIRLSRQGLEASEASYESVAEKYSQGAASILDVLDAQGALLRQRQEAALANYRYLQAIHRVQRSIAWFEFTKKPVEKEAWVGALKTFLASGELNAEGIEPALNLPGTGTAGAPVAAAKAPAVPVSQVDPAVVPVDLDSKPRFRLFRRPEKP